ncbi:hypothetical protein JTB14_028410 [Gonioctena quinquepunctata]|nr:hypothetical protein JTB14_028410 [Gonioctena quinquepunctata]
MAESDDYSTAIGILKAIYVKPTNEIFARHKLATRKQQSEESIDQYNQALQLLSKNCEFAELGAEAHRKTYVRNAFIPSINSDQIRLRLLEFSTLTLDEAIEKPRALESAKNQSASYSLNEAILSATSGYHKDDSSQDSLNRAGSI